MKKFLSFLLILLMLTALFATPVLATEHFDEGTEVVVENNVYNDETSDNPLIPDGMSIIVTLLVAGGTAVVLVVSHNKANRQISATNYVAENGYKVNNRKEQFVRTYTTVQRNFYGNDNNKN